MAKPTKSRRPYITPDDSPEEGYYTPKEVKTRGDGGQKRAGQETGQGTARTKPGAKKMETKPIPMDSPKRARNWEGEEMYRAYVKATRQGHGKRSGR